MNQRRGSGQPGSQPYRRPPGGTTYTLQADTNVFTLASQLGISEEVIINYNPGLTHTSIIKNGQIIYLPSK
jgi:hypothetical protein